MTFGYARQRLLSETCSRFRAPFQGSSEDTLIQINSPQNLVLSANCWVLE